jgi:hypothetical protein
MACVSQTYGGRGSAGGSSPRWSTFSAPFSAPRAVNPTGQPGERDGGNDDEHEAFEAFGSRGKTSPITGEETPSMRRRHPSAGVG